MTYCCNSASLQGIEKHEDLVSGSAWRRTEEKETSAVFHCSREGR